MIHQMITNKNSVLVAGTLVLDIIPVFETENPGSERAGAGGTVYLDKIKTQLGGSAGNLAMTLPWMGSKQNSPFTEASNMVNQNTVLNLKYRCLLFLYHRSSPFLEFTIDQS